MLNTEYHRIGRNLTEILLHSWRGVTYAWDHLCITSQTSAPLPNNANMSKWPPGTTAKELQNLSHTPKYRAEQFPTDFSRFIYVLFHIIKESYMTLYVNELGHTTMIFFISHPYKINLLSAVIYIYIHTLTSHFIRDTCSTACSCKYLTSQS